MIPCLKKCTYVLCNTYIDVFDFFLKFSAKTGFFPVDASTLEYLAQTGREKHSLKVTKEYLQKVGLFRINPDDNDQEDDVVYDEIIEIYLPDIVVTISGNNANPRLEVYFDTSLPLLEVSKSNLSGLLCTYCH